MEQILAILLLIGIFVFLGINDWVQHRRCKKLNLYAKPSPWDHKSSEAEDGK